MYKRMSKGQKGIDKIKETHSIDKPFNALENLRRLVHMQIPVERLECYLAHPGEDILLYRLDERQKSLDVFKETPDNLVPKKVIRLFKEGRQKILIENGQIFLPLITATGNKIGILYGRTKRKNAKLSEVNREIIELNAKVTATTIEDFRNHDELIESTVATKAAMIYFMIVLGVFVFTGVVARYIGPHLMVHYVASVSVVLGPIIFLNKQFYSWKDFGLDKYKDFKAIGFHVIVALTVCVFFTVYKYFMEIFAPNVYSGPFFSWNITFTGLLVYVLIICALQEFGSRVIPYTLLSYSLDKSMRDFTIIIVSALVFAFPHIHWSIEILIATIFIGLILILAYLRKPNFYGVWLSHAIIGTYALFVLQIQII